MTQIPSLLAVATLFCWPVDSKYLHFSVGGGGGGLIHETKLPMQELELKMQGLMYKGGVIAEFYGIYACVQLLFESSYCLFRRAPCMGTIQWRLPIRHVASILVMVTT